MPPFREALRDFSGDSGSESDSVTGSSISSASPTHTSGGATNERSSDGAGRSVRSNNDNDGPASPDTNASASPSGSQSPIVGKVTSPRSIRSIRSPSPSPPRHWSPESARSVKSDSQRSRSGSPQTARSPSVDSHKSAGSRSGSPQGSIKSESPKSPVSQRSARSKSRSLDRKSKASVSPTSNSSAYGSPKSHRSRSPGSPRSNKSGSPKDRRSSSQASHTSKRSASPGSPRSNRSRSGSAASRRSGSGSRKSNKSRSRTPPSPRTDGSPTSRKSQSPKGDRSDNESEKSLKTTGDDGQKVSSYTEVVKRKHRDSGSGSESDKIPKKKRITDSDSDVENNEKLKENGAEPTADALFGDASDISTDDEKDKGEEEEGRKSRSRSRSRSRSHSRSHSRSRSRSRSRGRSDSGGEGPSQRAIIEDDEEKEKEDEPEPPPETRIDVEIPKITTDLGREIHFVKLPNFLSVETRPFDHETYEDEIDEEETLDEEGRARLKLKVENTIRWKDVFNDEGKLVKESNARFVRWSDGSMSLHLGSEIFDVYKQPLQGDHNHLYIRQGTGLQGQAVFRTKLTFRPHSTESFTHRKMTMSLADRSQKTSGIKVLSQVGMNPDQNRYEMIKKEEEKLRMAMRVQNKSKKASGGGRASGRASGAYGGEAYHDDGSDDEGAISLAAIKNKYKKGGAAIAAKAASNIYSSDEEGSDFEATRPKKNIKGKVLKDSDEDSNTASESASGSAGETNNAGDAVSD